MFFQFMLQISRSLGLPAEQCPQEPSQITAVSVSMQVQNFPGIIGDLWFAANAATHMVSPTS